MSPVGAALLSTTLACYVSTPNIELSSEIICWAALVRLVCMRRRRGSHEATSNGVTSSGLRRVASTAFVSTRTWLFALGIAAACWYRAEERTVVLYPALTPLLLLSSGIRTVAPVATDAPTAWTPLTAKWNSVLIATFSCFALVTANGPSLPSLVACVVVIALLCGGYLAVSRSATLASDVDAESASDKQLGSDAAVGSKALDEELLALALCTLPLLVVTASMRIVVLHRTGGTVVRAVLVGVAKALSWFYTLRAARSSSWSLVGTIGTFAIASTRNILFEDQSSYLYAASQILAALLSLGQTVHLVSTKSTKPSSHLWVLAVVPLIPLLANLYGVGTLLQLRERHPIETLARASELRFEAMVARQSRSYIAAETEYRRRYGIEPPPGFEAWYNYTIAHESHIIDEFDMIHEALAPWLKMSGLQVRGVMERANRIRDVDLWKCELIGRTKELKCNHPFRSDGYIKEAFERWLKLLTVELPDLTFLANYLDEPRVMLRGEGSTSAEGVQVSNMARRPIWDKLTGSCPIKSNFSLPGLPGLAGLYGGGAHGLSFVTDTRADKDLCQHPEYRDMHGLVISPTSFTLIEGPVPVLTPGTVSTMGDVLFPSPSSTGEGFTYDDSGDVEWDKKKNSLYWAGSTTGGYAGNDSWKKFHRQRFVALARGLDRGRKLWYLRERDGIFRRVAWPVLLGRDLFDVAFSSAIQCDEKFCEAQRAYFDMHGRADQNAPFGSRLVFDLDGNGISGRFNKLLASRSAVLKQTLLREWHDERLIPWVHYIPVSQGLGELPEMVAWLTGTEEGRSRAKMVADRGRQWAARAMREQDRAIYVYRLLLELARIQDPGREAM
ncbi:hypothetical protein JDV02_009138 [Purpureocillium takamizusanense]|uniref:Glycosyl transferase CAP10 domain-containing protein n=1 Tax=Purpureocillium takamizusanense TaxID=2060973 RepID=A0A9Q8QNB9_9HYPO|nr:uncharacterized protein JDV02_009138 [Purpureocillium takamizusanense]UNI23308.1 hypothetical protein JDV02_009138 [Purpureocillium takamizusanense]